MPTTVTYHEPDRVYRKDEDEVDSWTIDWAQWLKGDTISTSDWLMHDSTTITGLTEDSSSNTATSATITLSGGFHGGIYRLVNRITTAAGLTKEKRLVIEGYDTAYRHPYP